MLRTLGAVALVVFTAAAVTAADRSPSAFDRGLSAYRSGAYAESVSLFDQALQQRPDDAVALYYRGLAEAHSKQWPAAIADLEKAAPQLPDVPVAGDLGVANYYAGNRAEATRWLQKAALDKRSAAPANLLLGIIAYEGGDLPSAQRYLAEADAAGDSRVKGTAAYYLGLIAVRDAHPADARNSFVQAQAAGEPAVAQAATGYLTTLSSARPGEAARLAAPYSLYAAGSFQYDSNLLIADIPLSQRQALPFNDSKDDGRFAIGLGADYTLLSDDQMFLQFGYDFYQSLNFSVDRLDLQGHTLWGVFEYGDGIVVPGFQGAYNIYLSDGTSTYLSRLWGSPYVVIQEAGFGQSEVSYTITGDNYIGAPFNPYRDSYNNAVGLRQSFFLFGAPDRRIDVGYQWSNVDTVSSSAGAADFDERSNAVDVAVTYNLPEIVWIQARWLFSNDNYLNGNSRAAPVRTVQPDGTVTVSRLRRRDDRNVVSLVLTRDLPGGLYASLGYYWTDSGSNIPVFQYSRSIVSATVGLTF